MNEKEIQELIQKRGSDFNMIIEDNSFRIDLIDIFQTDNPISEPTTRGGVYFAGMKEIKVQATILDTSVLKHLSNAMHGPHLSLIHN